MSKSELAQELGVHRKTLMRWIKKNKMLCAQLKKTGYYTSQKLFTPQQVELIQSYFE